MKKLFCILFTLPCALFALPALAASDQDKPVGFGELPAAAQQFIRTHFPDAKITLATVDREFMDTTYDVIFTDGMQIEFDSGGQWKEIECRVSFVPESVLLPAITAFIRERYPDAHARDIERDKRGYEVNLDNRAELYFDLKGNFMGYD